VDEEENTIMATHRVNCLIQKNDNALTLSIAPFLRDVRDRTPTVIWDAAGDGDFPETEFFNWKVGGPGSIPTRSANGKTLTLTYNQSDVSDWRYEISLRAGNCVVVIDPDIHNDPPPGGPPEEGDKGGKGSHRPR
jgi:hypothetical protein